METSTLIMLLAALAVLAFIGYQYMSSSSKKKYCAGLAAACKQGPMAAQQYCQQHGSDCQKYMGIDGFDCTKALAACK